MHGPGGGCVCDTSLEPGPSQDCPPSPPNEETQQFQVSSDPLCSRRRTLTSVCMSSPSRHS